MGKFTKPLLLTISVSSIGLAVFACKSSPNESSEAGLFDSKKKKIAEQVKSFNDTQKALIDANKRSASGCEKLDILWKKIEETQQSEAEMVEPKSKIKEVLAFGNGAAPRFWRIFEGWTEAEGGSEIRPYEENSTKFVRLTHRFSSLVKFKYVPNQEAVSKLGYTGQFAEGNNCVLGRLSSAVPTTVANRFTPALAAKFFTDGPAESQVLIAQHDIGGQSSGTDYTVNPPRPKTINNNFFLHYHSNRLSFEKGVPSGTGAFSRFFYTAQWFSQNVFKLGYTLDPRELQADHLAKLNPNGKPVSGAKGPRFIWIGAASPELKAQVGEMAKTEADFRKHFMSYNKTINNGANPMPVFNVYGSDTWTYEPEKDANLIGQFVATSNFLASEAADVRLFFKHSIQFRKIPEAEGKPTPYTQDYPFAEWNEKTFTGECRVGVREAEIVPKDRQDLDGTFIRDALINPKTVRKDANGKLCIIGIIEDKLEETAGPSLSRLLP